MSDFDKLMARSSNLAAISEELDKVTGSRNFSDDNIWKLQSDKAGNGEAIIRFLPAPDNEDLPTVRLFDHFFKGPGGWYVENSLTTLGKDDPMTEYNSALWDTGIEANRKYVSSTTKRRLNYYANILIVNDTANPENNGKVMLFRFGKAIMNIVKEATSPSFATDEKVNPFDLVNGADFRLRAYLKDEWPQYDRSTFLAPKRVALNGKELTNDEIVDIWKKCESLAAIIAPEKFKTYDELKARMNKVLRLDGSDSSSVANQERNIMEEIDLDDEIPSFSASHDASDEDDDMDFFKKLAAS